MKLSSQILFVAVGLFGVVASAQANVVQKNQCGVVTESEVEAGAWEKRRVCMATMSGSKKQYVTVLETRKVRNVPLEQELLWEVVKTQRFVTTGNRLLRRALSVKLIGQVENGLFERAGLSEVVGRIQYRSTRAGLIQSMQCNLNATKFTARYFERIFRKRR